MSDRPVILDARSDLRSAGRDGEDGPRTEAEIPALACDPLFDVVVL